MSVCRVTTCHHLTLCYIASPSDDGVQSCGLDPGSRMYTRRTKRSSNMNAACLYPRHRPQEYISPPNPLPSTPIHPHRQEAAPSTPPSQSTPPPPPPPPKSPPTTEMHLPFILTIAAVTGTALSKSRTCHGQRLYCGSSLSNMGTRLPPYSPNTPHIYPPSPTPSPPNPHSTDWRSHTRLDHRRNLGRSPKGPARLPQLADGQALRHDVVRVRRPARGGCAVVPECLCRGGVS